MELLAKVMHIYTKGFVEVELENGHRAIAQDFFNCKCGDIVSVKPEIGRKNSPFTNLPYLSVIIMAALGWVVGHAVKEKMLNAFLLGFVSFVISWLITRKARMRKQQAFEIISVIAKNKK